MKKSILFFLYLLVFNLVLEAENPSTGRIKGTITTSDGKPAEFVNVGLKGTGIGTTANAKGEYELKNLAPGLYTIVVSFIGLETKTREVELKAGETIVVDFVLVENNQQLQEVVVTVFKSVNEKIITIGKMGIKPMDNPQSTVVIEKEVLEKQQTLRMSDVLKNTNGVYQMGSTGGYQEEIAGRGFTFGSSNTFKNGVRFNNTVMPEMSSIERLEIMKGSTAILFGNVAAGGIINLITKKPQFTKGGEVSMRMGSYGFYKPSFDVYGAINNSKTAAYRINTTYEKSRSFRNNVESERFYINPSFLIKAGKKTDIILEGDYLNDKRTADFGVGAINYKLIDVPVSRFLGVSWGYYKSEQKSSTITTTHKFNDKWQLKNVTSYQNFSNDLFASQRPNGNSQFIKENGDWIRGLQRTKVQEEYYITQFDLTGKFSTGKLKHTFLFGADADKYDTKTTAYNAVSKYDTINVFDANKFTEHNEIPSLSEKTLTSVPIKRAGIYVQDLVSISPKLKVLAGMRFSYIETFSNVFTYATNSNLETKQFDKAFSPRLGIVYQPRKTTSLFASYSNSFTPNTGVDVNGKSLAPSVFEQYEAGIKNDLFKGLISANLTAYQIVNSNMAQMSLSNGNTNTNIKELAGEVTSKGLELDIMTKSWNGFSFIGGYSYNETRYTKSNTYIVGSKLKYNPNHTANASLYYSFNNLKALRGFNAGLNVLYFGDRAAGRSTRVTVPNDTYKLMPIPAFTQVDANIGYVRNSVSVRLKVSNIFNVVSYHVHDDNSVNPIAPRMVAATVAFKL